MPLDKHIIKNKLILHKKKSYTSNPILSYYPNHINYRQKNHNIRS